MKKFIAAAAVIMVLTGSMAFAANNAPMGHMAMNNSGYTQTQGYACPMGQNGNHMYQLSEQGKANSSSMWDSVCNFFGMHGGHGSHGGHYGGHYSGHNGGHNGRHM
ncbi:hypothetical protein [Halodesulfovibrio spirochaetisodalis]|uniref:Uncharacterized protein n=1 Tax=Halodesulfovibrio spirochaetisodalis TaxID=1560234 RepID=A0A1B7XAJ4_9BACT|nr:hypothetical protein [Halodesulfovibrio spirochaetisodalis]OBQ46356.1 hypothetical protein SP90_13180 [Halodesulfovibrio spirochaetisodalis]